MELPTRKGVLSKDTRRELLDKLASVEVGVNLSPIRQDNQDPLESIKDIQTRLDRIYKIITLGSKEEDLDLLMYLSCKLTKEIREYIELVEDVVETLRVRKLNLNKMWYVYFLQCKDGSIYTGITNSISRRLKKHQEGKGSKYTRSRLPVRLVFFSSCVDNGVALQREYYFKSKSRRDKLKYIESDLNELYWSTTQAEVLRQL